MPKKQHYPVLIFNKTVWVAGYFDMDKKSKVYDIYKRHARWPWCLGLTYRTKVTVDDDKLPEPLFTAYLYTEWSFATPKVSWGTDLWIPIDGVHHEIWYTRRLVQYALMTPIHEWEFIDYGRYPA